MVLSGKPPSLSIRFVGGTIEVVGLARGLESSFEEGSVLWDERTQCYRAPAVAYAGLVRLFVRQNLPYHDLARKYDELTLEYAGEKSLRPYQSEALDAFRRAQRRGIVVLPTGSGKTHVAVMAIADRPRSTLVVTPTLDLVRQWYDVLRNAFGVEVGLIGGGDYRVLPLTVTTYDSAHLHMEDFGNRFGMIIFDECHHLPSEGYKFAARSCLAPYRLGLTATPEQDSDRAHLLEELIGPVVYERAVSELAGDWLADYDTRRITVDLSAAERIAYEEARGIYLEFVRHQGLRLGGPEGWSLFIQRASRSAEGRRALDAYRKQRYLAVAASQKLEELSRLLLEHRLDRCIIFTLDNATAYAISRRFLVPIITHHTRVKERSELLERFSDGRYGAIVTSRVLNEGVDVPDANVAIVVSGTGSVREHVQRLGRVLRPRDGKRAILYELVTGRTAETATSERRREHEAYK